MYHEVLKFCPKCGGEPVIEHGGGLRYRVSCWWDCSCRHTTDWHLTEEQAIAEWNENNPMPNSLY